jgi:hypothetical protein
MPRMKRLVGTELDGTTVTMTIGKYQFDILRASYSDRLEVEQLSQMGSQEISAQTPGIYKVDKGKIVMSASVFRGELAPLLDQFGWGNREHSVVVSYTHQDLGSDSDMLTGCRLTMVNAAPENSAKPLEHEFELTYRQIFWTDARLTINRLGDVYQQLGLSKLD